MLDGEGKLLSPDTRHASADTGRSPSTKRHYPGVFLKRHLYLCSGNSKTHENHHKIEIYSEVLTFVRSWAFQHLT